MVEKKFLEKSGRQSVYPNEYIAAIEVRNHYELGKLTALKFLEWVQHNPNGVVAFTSGATPEFFVKFLYYYKNNWHQPKVQAELHSVNIKCKNFPNTTNLRLVQIEEIYPLSDKHYKKISNYTLRHYIKILGIKKSNTLLIDANSKGILAEKGMNVVFMNGKVDLSIMKRKATSQLDSWQQQAIKELRVFCDEYENKIKKWGGIDFFVGGISYNNSLGFNVPGLSADSKTHFVQLDYKTAAHTAKDLGGIENARGKIAITIGLGTLAINPNAEIIIMAAGEAKAMSVHDSMQHKSDPNYPASMLQRFPNSKFYLTAGAAKNLDDRETEDIRFKSKHGWQEKHVDKVITDIALAEKKAILALTESDLRRYERGRILLDNPLKPLAAMLQEVHAGVVKKIESGLKLSNKKTNKILHTSPHHDDIFLGYYPLFDVLAYKYQNNFIYFTSGFNSVSDNYILTVLNRASDWWLDKERDAILNKSYDKVIKKFRSYVFRQDISQMNMLETTLALKSLASIYKVKNMDELKHIIRWLKDDYFPSKQAGDKDVSEIRKFKGMIRESEADCLLSLLNIPNENILHLRSNFYSSNEFMKTPRYETDVLPFIKAYNNTKPNIITVADDPQGSPVQTNYKVLQIIAQGLRSKDIVANDNLEVWGYRNIWFRYEVSEANVFIPVSEHMLALQRRAFAACFNTQKQASFPSPFSDGDFASLTIMIQRQQYNELKILLGSEYFANNPINELKNASGFILLNKMSLNQFFRRAEDLQPAIELEESYISSRK